MNILDKIVNLYNMKLDSNKKNIVESSISVIGEEIKEFINDKINDVMPIYIITKSGLEITRETMELQVEEERLVNYLEDLLGSHENLYIGHYGYLETSTLELAKNSNNSFIMSLYAPGNVVGFHYKQDIYNGVSSKDLNFINHLLVYVGIKREGNKFRLGLGDARDWELVNAYSTIINELSTMILLKLRSDNIYVFDNKFLIQEYQSNLSDSFTFFYNTFKDLIPLLVMDTSKFINIVGREEFIELVNFINSNDIEEARDVVYKMLCNKNSKDNVKFNMSLIESSVRRYHKKYGK